MKVLFLILIFSISAVAQCDHATNAKARFDAIRLLPPVSIKHADLAIIEYLFEDRNGIYVGKLSIDSTTVKPDDFNKSYKTKKWWVLHSICDGHVYTIVEVLPTIKK